MDGSWIDSEASTGWIDDAARSLDRDGWYAGANVFPPERVCALADELAALTDQNRLKRAGIGRDRDYHVDRDIRRDWIHWMSGQRSVQAAFLGWAEWLRVELNRRLFLGLFEFEAHLALYPPGGFYLRHFDSFRGAANRMVSLVLYLNSDWHPGDGGELVVYAPDGESEAVRVEPRAGTLVLMLSEEIEHEVLRAAAPRASVAGWFRLNRNSAEIVDPPR